MSSTYTSFSDIRIFAEETTLTDNVKELLGADLLESCKQMRFYMVHSLQDIINAPRPHDIGCRKFMNLWYTIISISLDNGELIGDRLKINPVDWKKRISKKLITYPEKFFENTGIEFVHNNDYVEVISLLYPKMFFAMRSLFNASCALKESINFSNSFYCCDFRILCSKIEPADNEIKKLITKQSDKQTGKRKKEIEEAISDSFDGEMKKRMLDFIAYLRKNKMNPAPSSATSWKISYKACVVCYLRCDLDAGIMTAQPVLGEYGQDSLSDEFKETVWENTKKEKDCHGSCRCSYKLKTVFGRAFKHNCGLHIVFTNPNASEIECLKKLLEMRRNVIQNGKLLPALPRNFG